MKVRTTVQLNGKTATGLPVPVEVADSLGSGRRPKVAVTLNGYTFRTSISTWGGGCMIPLSSENRAGAGVKAGDEVQLEIVLDEAPRVIAVPPDLAAALDAEPRAKATFDSLSYSQKRWHVDPLAAAKKPETRARRIAKSVATLADGRAR